MSNFLEKQIENCRKNIANFPKILHGHSHHGQVVEYLEETKKFLGYAKNFSSIRNTMKESVNLKKNGRIEIKKTDTNDHDKSTILRKKLNIDIFCYKKHVRK